MEPQSNIGVLDSFPLARHPQRIFNDRFREDFTTDLHGWRVPHSGRPLKTGKVLRLRPNAKCDAAMSKTFPQSIAVAGAVCALEARASQHAKGTITFQGSVGRRQYEFQIGREFARHLFPVVDVRLEQVDIRWRSRGQVEIRAIELMSQPSTVLQTVSRH
jgi:hypothetical protein